MSTIVAILPNTDHRGLDRIIAEQDAYYGRSEPPRKTDMVIALMRLQDWRGALRIARTFRLGITEHQRKDLARGFEACDPTKARFFASINRDPNALIETGKQTLLDLYGARL